MSNTLSTPATTGFSPHRIEALTDGIYAVAMTLLVIELKLPDHAAIHTADQLVDGLVHLLPRFLAWAMSFFVLAFFWIGHHRSYGHLRRTDPKLVWLNIAQLAFVSLMPFSCDLVGEHGQVLVSQIIYSANMALLAVFGLLVSRHIFSNPDLAAVPMSLAMYRGARIRLWGLISISVVAVLIAMVVPSPGAGDAAFALMMIISPLSRRLERKAAQKAAA
jgi:uncharacterized membrane protein